MRTRICSFALLLASAIAGRAAAADQALSLVINPLTGQASIRNDTASPVSLDGYLLTSGQTVFNPATWTRLTGNAAFPGWAQGPAAPNRLGEANLLSSLSVGGGQTVALGSPYIPFAPSSIGQAEPGVKFEYSVNGVGSFEGDVVFAPQNNVVLLVNRSTGSATLQNQSQFGVNIDALLITSSAGVLDPVGWNGFAEGGAAGWRAGAAAANRLAEGNLLGSTFLSAGGAPVSIGKPINSALITDESELSFEYHVAGAGSFVGGVTFVSAAAPPLVGDYNGNGKVDAADYSIWRDTLGSTTDLRANGNNSGASAGKIDQADYVTWRSNFGLSGGSGAVDGGASFAAQSVPEPTTGAICLVAMSLAVFGRSGMRSVSQRKRAFNWFGKS
ncbi:MAG: hypothetical protein AB7G28_00515 [Pirellulales bacterium]